MKKNYLKDLYKEDEKLIIVSSNWLGRELEDDAVSRLIWLLLNHRHHSVRISSAVALGLIRNKAALAPLSKAVENDENQDVKYTSLLSISRIGPDDNAMKVLKKVNIFFKDTYIVDYIRKMEDMYD